MPNGRDRSRRPARRESFRTPKKKILIVCEGKNTEPQYFRQFAAAHRVSLVEIDVAPEAGVPLSVVQKAQKLRNKAKVDAKRQGDLFLAYDAVWCTFDVDEHPNIPEAIETARQSDLQVAVSNPCFELWLVLHHRDPPGLIHRHDVQRLLKTFLPGYDKHVSYDDYRAGYGQACQRARQLDQLAQRMNEPRRNPSTGVYRLTESIATPPREDPEASDPADTIQDQSKAEAPGLQQASGAIKKRRKTK